MKTTMSITNFALNRSSAYFILLKNRVLRRIFGPRRDEGSDEWRKFHEKLNNLYSSPNIVRVLKSRIMRWAEHVARMGDRRGIFRVLVGNLRERGYLGDQGLDGRIILKLHFKR